MKRIFFVSAIVLASCGYDGHYRYECQDPENWEAKECNPPICLVDGMCTETLLGFNPREVVETSVPVDAEQEVDAPTTEEDVTP